MEKSAILKFTVLLLITEQIFTEDEWEPTKVTDKYVTWKNESRWTEKITKPPAACDPGYYQTGGNTCRQCGLNTYTNTSGARFCTPCPEGLVAPLGSVSVEACVKGTCPDGRTECPGGKGCYDLWQRCDGRPQCPDGYDEADETCKGEICPTGTARCQDGSQCVGVKSFCDGKKVCADGADEDLDFCRDYPCPFEMIKCGDGLRCIDDWRFCDGKKDCPDNSDEDPEYCEDYKCIGRRTKCDDGLQCVLMKAVCTGKRICNDGSHDHTAYFCEGDAYKTWPIEETVEHEKENQGGFWEYREFCRAGRYKTWYGRCLECPENTHSAAGSTECTPCPEGLVSPSDSQSIDACKEPCLAGDYRTETDCQQCEENTYSGAGAHSCTSCPEGMISPAGSTSEDDCEYDVRPTCDCWTPECGYCSNPDCAIQINTKKGLEVTVTSRVTWKKLHTIVLYDEDGNVLSRLRWNLKNILIGNCFVCKTEPALREASKNQGEFSSWEFSLVDGLLTVSMGGEVLYQHQLPKECEHIYSKVTSFSFYDMTCENTYSLGSGAVAGERMDHNCAGTCPVEEVEEH